MFKKSRATLRFIHPGILLAACTAAAVTGAAHAQFAATCTASSAQPVGPGVHAFDLRTISAPGNGTGAAFCADGTPTYEQWLTYVPTFSGLVAVDLTGVTGGPVTINTVQSVGSGPSCDFSSFFDVCSVSDDPCAPNGLTKLQTTAGVPVILRVSAPASGRPFGNLRIVENPVGPAGDTCATAVPATLGANVYSTAGSVGELDFACNWFTDTWLVYIPAASGGLVASVCGQAGNDSVALYSGCSATNVLDCGNFNDDDFASPPCRAKARVTAGVPVYIRLGQSCPATRQVTLALLPASVIPANDQCANALTAVEGSNIGDNTFAGTDGVDACVDDPFGVGGFGSGRDIWFRFTPAATASYDLAAGFDVAGLSVPIGAVATAVFATCAAAQPPATAIACANSGFSSVYSRVALTAGTPYLVRVAGAGRPVDGNPFSRGEVNLQIRRVVPPTNDPCSGATLIAAGEHPFDLLDASPDGARPCSGDPEINDVWFRFIPPASGPFEIGLVEGQGIGTAEITVTSNCGGSAPTVIAATANDTMTGAQLSRLILQGVAGQQVLIRIAADVPFPSPSTGRLYVGPVRAPAPPGNDSCASAQVLAGLGTIPFSMSNATQAPQSCGSVPTCQTDACTTAINADIFFRFVAPRTGPLTIRVNDGEPYFFNDTFGAGAVIAVLDTCASAPSVCGLPCGDFPADSVQLQAQAGQTYIIRIGRYIGAPWPQDGGTLTITCPADFNGDGTRDVTDIFAFLSAWFAGAPGSDFDNSGARNVADIFAFLSAWFAGC